MSEHRTPAIILATLLREARTPLQHRPDFAAKVDADGNNWHDRGDEWVGRLFEFLFCKRPKPKR